MNNFTVAPFGWEDQNRFPRFLGDVNGDGRDDIIGFGDKHVWTALSRGNGTFGRPQIAHQSNYTLLSNGWVSQEQYPRLVGDINGDGRDDIVGFGVNNVYASLGQANGTFGQANLALRDRDQFAYDEGWTSQTGRTAAATPRMLGDVNGDGRDDIVGIRGDQVFVGLAVGDGTFAPDIRHNRRGHGQWPNLDQTPMHLADVNGDGRDDLIVFDQNEVKAAIALGSGGSFRGFSRWTNLITDNFTLRDNGWVSNNDYPRFMGDFNGDNKADILGFG
ncbi:MAG: VCBS repeat-containing protein [Synechococcales bacterium]|nr:VCBS repeat-containing protein [Synechococcales bacterium]